MPHRNSATTPARLPLLTAKKQRGRPSLYSPELAKLICAQLAEGESLRSICRAPGMPSTSTVLAWVASRPDFRRQYDDARYFGRVMLGEEVLDIADDVWRRNLPTALDDARQEIDAIKWRVGRMAPKRRAPRPIARIA